MSAFFVRRSGAARGRPFAQGSGFGLVELMVAMTLSLLIAGAVGALYVSSKQTFRVQDNSSGIDETLRAIEEDMSSEIRKAGYFGCFRWKVGVSPGAASAFAITARLDTAQNGTYTIPKDGAAVKLGVDYDVNGGAASGTSVSPLQADVTIKPGTEFMSVSYGQPLAYLGANMSSGTEPLTLSKPIAVKNGQPLIVTNCDAMVLMRADQTGTYSSIAHDPLTGDNVSLGDPVWGYTLFGQGSTVMSFQSSVFFLGQKAGNPPTLYVLSPDNTAVAAQPLAANVEQLNFLYGVDTGGASLVFNTAATVTASAAWSQVRAVRVGVVVRSAEDNVSGVATGAGVAYTWDAAAGRYTATSTAADTRLRKAHTFTVAIRGRSPVI